MLLFLALDWYALGLWKPTCLVGSTGAVPPTLGVAVDST